MESRKELVMSFVIAKPLPYDKVTEITLKSIAPTEDGARLIITGVDAKKQPVQIIPPFNHPVTKEILLKELMTQLEMYGSYANMEAAYKAVVKEAAKGTRKIKVKLVLEEYIGKGGRLQTGTRTIFDPAKFNTSPTPRRPEGAASEAAAADFEKNKDLYLPLPF